MQPELRQRLVESPDEVFQDFDLTDDEKDILRRPDERLLALLGSALARQAKTKPEAAETAAEPVAVAQAVTLPGLSLALTLAPYASYENGEFKGVNYTAWVSPLPAGADPASLPAPPGASALPGMPMPPLHAAIQVNAVQMADASGRPVVALSASFRQSSNVAAPPPPQMAGDPEEPPFGSDLRSEAVREAIAAVRAASKEERYGRIVDLLRVLRTGEVR